MHDPSSKVHVHLGPCFHSVFEYTTQFIAQSLGKIHVLASGKHATKGDSSYQNIYFKFQVCDGDVVFRHARQVI